jgi:ankyrin repeat protein
MANLLLAKGADLNAKDRQGMTPMDWAKKKRIQTSTTFSANTARRNKFCLFCHPERSEGSPSFPIYNRDSSLRFE